MKDWKTLLATKAFRGFCLALVCYDLGTWCVIATLPILIAERFDAAGALVLGLGIRILPRIALAPLAGAVLQRVRAGKGGRRGMGATGLLDRPAAVVRRVRHSATGDPGHRDVGRVRDAGVVTLRYPTRRVAWSWQATRCSSPPTGWRSSPDRRQVDSMATMGFAAAFCSVRGTDDPGGRHPRLHSRARSHRTRRSHIGQNRRAARVRAMLRSDPVLVGLLICAVP